MKKLFKDEDLTAHELRIGNFVTDEFYDTFNKTITVENINEKGINLSIENSDDYPEMQSHWIEPYYKFEELRGIPLTEDWMERLGFEYLTEPVPDSVNPFRQNFGFDFYKKEKIKLQSHYRSFTEKTLTIWATQYHQIHYLHQLQNLYFALTGEELTLKPLNPLYSL